MKWLKSVSKMFSNKAAPDDDTVFFEGPDTYDTPAQPGDYWFWFSQGGIELPGVTSDPALIARLQQMKPGDGFKITGEIAEGAMGTRVTAIETAANENNGAQGSKPPKPKL